MAQICFTNSRIAEELTCILYWSGIDLKIFIVIVIAFKIKVAMIKCLPQDLDGRVHRLAHHVRDGDLGRAVRDVHGHDLALGDRRARCGGLAGDGPLGLAAGGVDAFAELRGGFMMGC